MSSQKPTTTAEEEAYVSPPVEEGGPTVTTRARDAGKPALKPGALNPDAYYQEKDEGYGDVGVRQEADETSKDTEKKDPTFEPTGAEVKAAGEEAAQGEEVLKEAGGPAGVRREEKERGEAEGAEEKEEVVGAAQA